MSYLHQLVYLKTAPLPLPTDQQPRFQIKVCVATLSKYLENIILNPTDEKYRKIRKSNKAYQVGTCLKVAQARGANLGSF